MDGLSALTESEVRIIINNAPLGMSVINEKGTILSNNIRGEELIKKINVAYNNTTANIFEILMPLFPTIKTRIEQFKEEQGVIFFNERAKFLIKDNNDKIHVCFLAIGATKFKSNQIVIACEDITEQHKKEEAMRQAMLDKAVEKGKFEIASDVLHDIGNAIVGFGSYLTRIKRISEQSNIEKLKKLAGFFETQKEAFATAIGEPKTDALIAMLTGISHGEITNQTEIQKSITEQMNIISHIQEILNIQRQYIQGHETSERKPVNIRSVINDCMSMLFASFDKRGIAVSLDIPDKPVFIKGDRTKLMQVILNILKNSTEAIEITQQQKAISISLSQKEDSILLKVHDTGEGFDKIIGEKLFSRGYTTKSSGTGLGLYNCKTIIEGHSGTINITSEGPGKGALTTIQFAA